MEKYSKEFFQELTKKVVVSILKKGEVSIQDLLKKQPTIKIEYISDNEPYIVLINDFRMNKGYFDWNILPIYNAD